MFQRWYAMRGALAIENERKNNLKLTNKFLIENNLKFRWLNSGI